MEPQKSSTPPLKGTVFEYDSRKDSKLQQDLMMEVVQALSGPVDSIFPVVGRLPAFRSLNPHASITLLSLGKVSVLPETAVNPPIVQELIYPGNCFSSFVDCAHIIEKTKVWSSWALDEYLCKSAANASTKAGHGLLVQVYLDRECHLYRGLGEVTHYFKYRLEIHTIISHA
jgi:hypothetical protein